MSVQCMLACAISVLEQSRETSQVANPVITGCCCWDSEECGNCSQEARDGAKPGARLAAEHPWAHLCEHDPANGPPVVAYEERPIPEVRAELC